MKISPAWAPILFSIFTCVLEKPAKPPFSFRVKNKPNNRSVYKNIEEMFKKPDFY